MDSTQTPDNKMHPVMWVAAIAVTLFSIIGIGAVTGLIPVGQGDKPAEVQTPSAAAEIAPPTPLPALPPSQAQQSEPAVDAAPKPKPKAAAKPAPSKVAQNAPARGEAPPAPAKAVCSNCGVVDYIREVEQKGDGTGVGAVGGAVAGGLLGRQVGGGRGRDVMTVVGAVAGGVAGHQIEKKVRATKSYEVTVRMDDGSTRVVTEQQMPAWRIGDKVKVVDGALTAAN